MLIELEHFRDRDAVPPPWSGAERRITRTIGRA
jgi:hypothetical protein